LYLNTQMEASELLNNLNRLHTTELSIGRIRANTGFSIIDPRNWCKNLIKKADSVVKMDNKWYVISDGIKITINADTYVILTAHIL